MTFKLKANPTFKRTVQIQSLDGESMELKLIFKHMRASVLKAFVEGLPGRQDIDVMADLLVGWEDVDTEFSEQALRDLIEEHVSAPAKVWLEYQAAYQDALRKN